MKMKNLFIIAIGLRLLFLTGCTDQTEYEASAQTHDQEKIEIAVKDHQNIKFKTINGEETSLADFDGKVVLIVNTASKCGFTKQYVGLEELYREKKADGLAIIAFPANNFAQQEPGTDDEIRKFCQGTFDVTFPLMSKIDVIGDNIHPLFNYLTEESPVPGKVRWNFNKFLLDRDGTLVARFEAKVEPDDPELVAEIEKLL
jgi:glutathione peroxidase